MKKLIPILSLMFFMAFNVVAQQKSLNEIASFKIKNSGPFMDKNNDVDGYYFFYEVDKLKKGQREYAIRMLDNNLNDIATKSYIDSKKTTLAQSNFNNQALMFAMIDFKENNYNLVSFDRQGNKGKDVVIPFTKKEVKWLKFMASSGDFNLLFPVDNKGFIFNYVKNNKKIGYGLKYVATDGGKSWNFNSPAEAKEILTVNPIQANENILVALETSKKSLLSQTVNFRTLVIDINTGKLLYDIDFERDTDPRLMTNAFITKNNNVVLLGEYFKKGDNVVKAKSEGLFAQVLDMSGKVVTESKVSWENKIDKMMPTESDGKERKNNYIYFHDIVRTKSGSYYCIGEVYRKTISALGMLGLSANAAGNNTKTQLTITDAVIFKFDDGFNLQDIKVFAKGKSRVPSLTDFGSPQLNAHALKSYGAFDYEFTQIDTQRDRFYATFIDYERLKGESNKLAFKSIMYNEGQLTEDKIYLQKSKGNIRFRVMPAKLGHVMLLEYNRKEKTIDVHLEKLNF